MNDSYIAHVKQLENAAWAKPHGLGEHLRATAAGAERFAEKFASSSWGKAAGYAHDLGKGRKAWQDYLKKKSGYRFDIEAHLENKAGKLPHAIFGAIAAEKAFGKGKGRILSYIIAGHHSGLPDWSNVKGQGRASLNSQMQASHCINDIAEGYLEAMLQHAPGELPWRFSSGLDLSLWLRMLYSALVDADFLDTEEYMNKRNTALRRGYPSISCLNKRLNHHISELERSAPDTEINRLRKEVNEKCEIMARQNKGIFSLTVPTGGGKTLSSLTFALNHAVHHNMSRVIYVIPYTSIIEQNADVIRKAIGRESVIEHHSNLDMDDETPKTRLAAENWDAPVVVTTTVQFFESLFAAKPSRCRKLHNIANSVIVLDEAQLLPTGYLQPILETIQLLADRYGASLVISTATQPAFKQRNTNGNKFRGLDKVTDIIGGGLENLYAKLKRATIRFPENLQETSSWEEIAHSLNEHEQVLCIVSDRKSCRELHSLMPPDTYHLSALMCGQHRSQIITKIKDALKRNEPVRVISTQLVEAGVDIDFPVVYRALAGLDSIAQAAGRCNREGLLAQGVVRVFVAPRRPPKGILRKAADVTQGLLALKPQDPLSLEMFEKFFSELYIKVNSLDEKDIIALLSPDMQECAIYFRTAAKLFNFIDDSAQANIIVRYGNNDNLIETLKATGPERWLMRKLQRFNVTVHLSDFKKLNEEGSLEEVYPSIFAMRSAAHYSDITGLLVEMEVFSPEGFIL